VVKEQPMYEGDKGSNDRLTVVKSPVAGNLLVAIYGRNGGFKAMVHVSKTELLQEIKTA
jgi:hypothetical protein